jgi:predicted nucleotidyltransferase
MRLTKRQRITAQRVLQQYFGEDAKVWLFGSRVRDEARGGDFDFLVETQLADPDQLVDAKLRALAALHATPEFEGEKIDLVLETPLHTDPLPIHETARAEGIRL